MWLTERHRNAMFQLLKDIKNSATCHLCVTPKPL